MKIEALLLICFGIGTALSMGPLELYQKKFAQLRWPNKRSAHSRGIRIPECMHVTMEPGRYYYESDGSGETCGLYMTTDYNHLVEVEITYVDVTCDTKGLVVFFDGWELNGHVFPSMDDHKVPFEQRFKELCSQGKPITRTMTFVASQNAALMQYRIPEKGQGFVVNLKILRNPEPCNILMSDTMGVYSLTNLGQKKNCTLTTLLFPANIEVVDMKVGIPEVAKRRITDENGIIAPCSTSNHRDFIEFGGSADLESNDLETSETICGDKNRPSERALTILCESSTIRLVSSGSYQNTLTVMVREAKEQDLDYDTNFVMACADYM